MNEISVFCYTVNTMQYLATLRDGNIFSKTEYSTPAYYEKRITVKAIVKNKEGQFAFVTNPVHNFFLLAGGGAESKNLEEEIKRECVEEIRHEVRVLREVGRIHEFRNRDTKEYETVCFLVEAVQETSEDLRTEDEKKNELSVVWLNAERAKNILDEQAMKVREGKVGFYNTAFNILRDQIFFTEYLKQRDG